jgi:hypothetical protein
MIIDQWGIRMNQFNPVRVDYDFYDFKTGAIFARLTKLDRGRYCESEIEELFIDKDIEEKLISELSNIISEFTLDVPYDSGLLSTWKQQKLRPEKLDLLIKPV